MQVNRPDVNNGEDKVESMFDSIAWRYDFLNHFLSFGTDRLWRRRAILAIRKRIKADRILDVATGTGDLAIASMKLSPEKVYGIDISERMLDIGKVKIRRQNLEDRIELTKGDSECISFIDNTFDAAMVAFGVRNFSDPLKGLSEMHRVLRDGGLIMVLEFSRPAAFLFRQVYRFYFLKILPLLGRLFSRNKQAYRYLPDSVMNFPDNEDFMHLLAKASFKEIEQERMTGGIASIYTGFKRGGNN